MNKSKAAFVAITILFLLVILFFVYDIFTRTSPPWNKRKNKTLMEQETIGK